MNNIIELKNVSFKYGDKFILDKINLKIPSNSIYGFLGNNGSGKTTTIKILLGLLRIQSGEVFYYGEKFPDNKNKILNRIGSFIESPTLYPNMNVSDYLKTKQIPLKIPQKNIDKYINLLGLENYKKKKTKELSLGLKQRLSIAYALINEPDILILDEPTNGLDPSGIKEVRDLILTLNKEHGKTIFISSHLLTEVEKIASKIAIIDNAKILYEGSLKDFGLNNNEKIELEVNEPENALLVIEKIGYKAEINNETNVIICECNKNDIGKISHALVENNIIVTSFTSKKNSLEDMYFNLKQQ